MSDRRRMALSLAALAGLYVAVIALGDTHAWSGSDAGGKVATIRWMATHHSWRPDVGYWAARFDPSGIHHPLYHTSLVGHRWVQVTSLPFVYVGLLLWRVGGTAAILAIPVGGSLLAAYAARRLALAVGATRGWAAFWLVGVATPMLFYAGDFWEHSLAVGLVLLGLALAFEGGVAKALAAGLLVGLAAVMRTEVLLYAAALGMAALALRDERRAWFARPARVAALLGGLTAPLVANALVEKAVLGASLRTARAGSGVASAGADLGTRFHDGLLTAIGLFGDDSGRAFAAGALVVVALLLASRSLARGTGLSLAARAGAALAAALYLARIFPLGLVTFVPGFLPAAPVSAAGITAAATSRQRALAVAAVGVLPVVWLLQWRGQLLPQWGGRYVLLSAALLTVVGACAIERVGWRHPAAAALVGFGLVVAALSAVWHVERTRAVARGAVAIERVPAHDVIVSRLAHMGREDGAFYGRHRWLSADGDTGTRQAAAIAHRAGAPAIDVLDVERGKAPQALPGWRPTTTRLVPYFGVHLSLVRYSRV